MAAAASPGPGPGAQMGMERVQGDSRDRQWLGA
jgi:hypothetical protein